MKETKEKIKFNDVKQALKDERFRKSLPEELQPEVAVFVRKPNCGCHMKLIKKIINKYPEKLMEYYPNKVVVSTQEDMAELSKNNFSVINCTIDELEEKLHNLPAGRKQIAIARYDNEVTVIINELDYLF